MGDQILFGMPIFSDVSNSPRLCGKGQFAPTRAGSNLAHARRIEPRKDMARRTFRSSRRIADQQATPNSRRVVKVGVDGCRSDRRDAPRASGAPYLASLAAWRFDFFLLRAATRRGTWLPCRGRR